VKSPTGGGDAVKPRRHVGGGQGQASTYFQHERVLLGQDPQHPRPGPVSAASTVLAISWSIGTPRPAAVTADRTTAAGTVAADVHPHHPVAEPALDHGQLHRPGELGHLGDDLVQQPASIAGT